jgi:TetR/AcrR family transcriptional repressor of nem operon
MDAAHELIWSYSFGSVTIEAICERAGVRKGSFYYFFDSKSDLAVAAISAWWVERKALASQIFIPEVPPLERITRYLDFAASSQIAEYEASGRILGCPIFTLGSEICTQNEPVVALIQDILSTGARLFGEAIRDANANGDISCNNPELKGRQLWAFYEGTLTRARIENNPDLLRSFSSDALELIGARPAVAILA